MSDGHHHPAKKQTTFSQHVAQELHEVGGEHEYLEVVDYEAPVYNPAHKYGRVPAQALLHDEDLVTDGSNVNQTPAREYKVTLNRDTGELTDHDDEAENPNYNPKKDKGTEELQGKFDPQASLFPYERRKGHLRIVTTDDDPRNHPTNPVSGSPFNRHSTHKPFRQTRDTDSPQSDKPYQDRFTKTVSQTSRASQADGAVGDFTLILPKYLKPRPRKKDHVRTLDTRQLSASLRQTGSKKEVEEEKPLAIDESLRLTRNYVIARFACRHLFNWDSGDVAMAKSPTSKTGKKLKKLVPKKGKNPELEVGTEATMPKGVSILGLVRALDSVKQKRDRGEAIPAEQEQLLKEFHEQLLEAATMEHITYQISHGNNVAESLDAPGSSIVPIAVQELGPMLPRTDSHREAIWTQMQNRSGRMEARSEMIGLTSEDKKRMKDERHHVEEYTKRERGLLHRDASKLADITRRLIQGVSADKDAKPYVRRKPTFNLGDVTKEDVPGKDKDKIEYLTYLEDPKERHKRDMNSREVVRAKPPVRAGGRRVGVGAARDFSSTVDADRLSAYLESIKEDKDD